MRKIFFTLITIVVFSANAYDFMVDGICYNVNGMYVSDGVTVTYENDDSPRYTSLSGDIVIPDSVHYRNYTLPVTAIDEFAFEGCTEITSATINCPTLGEYAFYNCSGLTSVTIGKAVTSFNATAFYECTGLTSVIWNAKAIDDYSLEAIGMDCSIFFPYSTNICSFIFGDEVEIIPEELCRKMTGLTSITIPESVTYIGYKAFHNCTGLTSVTWNSKKWILDDGDAGEAHIFDNLSNIESFVFGDEVEMIPGYLCNGLSGLNHMNIPASVTSIGENAFDGCSGLETIQIADENTVFDSRDNCNAIIETNTNTLISGCKNTTIPSSVTSIGSDAFSGCTGLTEITIPKTITVIGRTAFMNCTGLRSINNYVNHPAEVTLSDNVFDKVPKDLCTLYVTQGRIGEYRLADQWGDFTNITEGEWMIPVDSVSLNETELSLFVGGTATLHSQISPADASHLELSWQSSDTSIVTIRARSQEWKDLNRNFDKSLPLKRIRVKPQNPQHFYCEYFFSRKPNGVPDGDFSVNTSNSQINDNGNQYGSEVLTDVGDGWYEYEFSETVYFLEAQEYVGEGYVQVLVDSEIEPLGEANVIGEKVSIIAKTPGTATITGTTTDGTGLSTTCEVTVQGITNLTFDKTSTDIYVGSTDTLTAIITPNEVINKNLIWQSSDTTTVAIITGSWQTLTNNFDQSLPFKRIRVKPQNPNNYYCEYFFSRKPNGVPDGEFSVNTSTPGINDNGNQYGSEVLTDVGDGWYEYEFNETVYFLMAQENVGEGYVQVFVDQTTGSITEAIIVAVGPGTATITATTTDGSNLSASCQVNVSYEYALVSDTIKHTRGEDAAVIEYPVELINKNIISGLQFEVELPEGVSLVFDEDVADVWLDDNRKARDHSIDVSALGNRHYLFMISSATNKELKGNDGTLFYMKLLVDQYHDAGIYNINYINLTLAEANETEHTAVNTSATVQFNYMLGDADADAKVDVADYITTALYILQRPTLRFYEDAANVHSANPVINVTDLTGITNIALGIRPTEILHTPELGDASHAGDMEPKMNVNVQKLNADRWVMSIDMNNYQPLAAMQFDLLLPDGITYENASLTDRASKLQITDGTLPDGTVRLLVSAFNAGDIKVGSGEVLNITLKGNPAADGMAIFDNITLAERSLNSYELEPMSVPFTLTAIDGVNACNEVRIYTENGCIVIESPYAGTAQLVLLNGISAPLKVLHGRNIYKVDKNEYYIVRFGTTIAKLRF